MFNNIPGERNCEEFLLRHFRQSVMTVMRFNHQIQALIISWNTTKYPAAVIGQMSMASQHQLAVTAAHEIQPDIIFQQWNFTELIFHLY